MKNIFLSAFFALLIAACVAKEAKNKEKDLCCSKANSTCCTTEASEKTCCSSSTNGKAITISVDKLLDNPEDFVGKNVTLSGSVASCNVQENEMRLAGSNDAVYVMVESTNDQTIKFEAESVGKKIMASGTIHEIDVKDQNHNGESLATEHSVKRFKLLCNKVEVL